MIIDNIIERMKKEDDVNVQHCKKLINRKIAEIQNTTQNDGVMSIQTYLNTLQYHELLNLAVSLGIDMNTIGADTLICMLIQQISSYDSMDNIPSILNYIYEMNRATYSRFEDFNQHIRTVAYDEELILKCFT